MSVVPNAVHRAGGHARAGAGGGGGGPQSAVVERIVHAGVGGERGTRARELPGRGVQRGRPVGRVPVRGAG